MNCKIYVATKMSGRDRQEMVTRANEVCAVLRGWGLTPISPVLEEGVANTPGLLLQTSNEQLKGYWKRDKDIIAYEAHVILIDEGQRKSLGVEREYGYARYCLWKPTLTILPPDQGPNIACFEDDTVVQTVDAAASVIAHNWGTRWLRCKWRFRMLLRTLPLWIYRQLMQWR